MSQKLREYQKVQVWIHALTPSEPGQPEHRKVLVLRTLPSRNAFWQPVTGSVEPGETIEAAALREAQEETGLDFASPPKPLGMDFYFETQWGRAHEHVFELEARVAGSIRLDPHEHDFAQWVSPAEALKMLKFSSNLEALRRLMESWARR